MQPPPIVQPPEPSKPVKPFGLPEVSALAAVLIALALTIVLVPNNSPEAVGEAIGHFIGIMLVSGIIAGIVGVALRRSAPKAGVWTFAGMVVVVAAVGLGNSRAVSDRQTKNAADALQREAQAMKNERGAGEPTKADFERMERAADRFAENSGSKDKAAAQMGADLVRCMTQIGRDMQDATQKLTAAGGVAHTGLTSAGDCDTRLRAVDQFETVAKNCLDRVRGIDAEIDRLAQARALDAAQLATFKSGFRRSSQIDKIVRIREIDVELADVFREYLRTLRDTWGRWSVRDGQLVFENQAEVIRFNAAAKKMQALSTEQAQLIEEARRSAP